MHIVLRFSSGKRAFLHRMLSLRCPQRGGSAWTLRLCGSRSCRASAHRAYLCRLPLQLALAWAAPPRTMPGATMSMSTLTASTTGESKSRWSRRSTAAVALQTQPCMLLAWPHSGRILSCCACCVASWSSDASGWPAAGARGVSSTSLPIAGPATCCEPTVPLPARPSPFVGH